jgi:hypothetical protein
MSRSNADKKLLGAGHVVAVAIENNKTSQHAVKWAVENLLPKDQHLFLINVKQKSNSSTSIPCNSFIHEYINIRLIAISYGSWVEQLFLSIVQYACTSTIDFF